jgi:hypothetical protein
VLCFGGEPGQRNGYSDSLWAGQSGDRIPLWAKFSAPIQTDGGAHLVSCKIKKRVSSLGVKRPPTSSAEAKEREELLLYSPSGP